MQARYARQIRHGIWVARVHLDLAGVSGRRIRAGSVAGLSELEYRAYRRTLDRGSR